MVASHPYSVWPLHVKIFSPTSEKAWQAACKELDSIFPKPLGFTMSVELEGVDGKASDRGSRQGPIDVKDAQWTHSHLTKRNDVLSLAKIMRCTVCKETIKPEELSSSVCNLRIHHN
jgi:structure-specific endonuclease subunit SLX1